MPLYLFWEAILTVELAGHHPRKERLERSELVISFLRRMQDL